jgi:hypothetical protein
MEYQLPVPGFDGRGFLPPYIGVDGTTADRSPYEATMSEIISALGTTPTRRNLLGGILGYRTLLAGLGYAKGIQFVDGSFAENVEAREGRPPNDIDVVSFLVRPDQYRNDPSLWKTKGWPEWANQIANKSLNKKKYSLDTYAIAVDQHNALGLINATTYWYSLFAHKRITHDWKGFIKIALNPTDDAAASLKL